MRKSSDEITDVPSEEVSLEGSVSRHQQTTLIRPAFFLALIALAVIFVVIGMMTRNFSRERDEDEQAVSKAVEIIPKEEEPEPSPEQTALRQPAIVIFYQVDSIDRESITESGFFDPRLIFEAVDREELADLVAREGVSVVIDGQVEEIRHEDGRVIPLPVGEQIVESVLKLLEEKQVKLEFDLIG